MSNQINAEDWNIDKFSSVVFPNTTPVSTYRNHLSSFNIQNIQTSTYGPSYLASDEGFGDQYEVIARKLQDPGNLDFFMVEGGWVEDIQAIRQYQMGFNTFGPSTLRAVDTNNIGGYSDEFGEEITGYLEYSKSAIADGSIRSFSVDGYPSKATPAIGPSGNKHDDSTALFEVYNKITRQVDITQLDSIGISSRGTAGQQRQSQRGLVENRKNTWEKEGEIEFYLGGTVNDNRGVDFNQSNFGPSVLRAVDIGTNGGYCDEFGAEITKLHQYPVGFGTDIRGSITAQQAGFGVSAGIEFKVPTRDDSGQVTLQDSQLDQIGKERREQEFLNRLKANATSETLGKINLDPFGLLSGQDLIIKDYTITKPKTLGGEVLDFATKNLIGIELPVSIIPDDIYPQYGSGDKTSETLLDYTGAGQKAVLYNNLLKNKYGPEFEDSSRGGVAGLLDKVGGPGDPPQKQGYLDYKGPKDGDFTRNTSVVDKLNSGVKSAVNSLLSIGRDNTITEAEVPTSTTTDPTKMGTYDLGFNIVDSTIDTEQGLDAYKFGNISNSSKRHSVMDTQHVVDDWLGVDIDKLYWNSDREDNLTKRGLLNYTQNLIRDKVGPARFIGEPNSDSNQKVTNGLHKSFSVGNLVKEGEGTTNDGYCRSWSVRRAYTSYGDLIRNKGLNPVGGGADTINQKSGSVLKDPGLVKIAWETGGSDSDFEGRVIDKIITNKRNHGVASQYMLSLENLAWKDSPHFDLLPTCELGPNGGRIMWFPPYNIDFSDNTTASWDSTSFIGRSEPIYTYNNTERTGTLSFSIIMDHSSMMNTFDNSSVEQIDRFLWGCGDLSETALNEFTSPAEMRKIDEYVGTTPEEAEEVVIKDPSTYGEIPQAYFRNARHDGVCGKNNVCDSPCISGEGCVGRWIDETYESGDGELNNRFFNEVDDLVDFLVGKGRYEGDDSGKYYTIKIAGHTSGSAPNGYNTKLGLDRALSTKEYLLEKLITAEGDTVVEYNVTGTKGTPKHKSEIESSNDSSRWQTITKGEQVSKAGGKDKDDENLIFGDNDHEEIDAKKARTSTIELVVNKARVSEFMKDKVDITPKTTTQKNDIIREIAKRINKRVISECDIFEKVKEDEPFIYNSIKEKIKHFHPAFHSLTPEMFNNRLTFLQQCMRQGPQLTDTSQPQNMAFGRPPVCVLRVGDFYHTKVIIDSLNISYAANSGVQWDLNPEGAGVQPMYANVDLNFKFIGGSSLGGPIRQLQNAVSFNFYANTSLYRPLEIFKSSFDGDNFELDVEGKTFYYGAYGNPDEENNPQKTRDDQFEESGVEYTNEDIGAKTTTLTPEQQKTFEDGYDNKDNETVHTIDVGIDRLVSPDSVVSFSNGTTNDINNQEVDIVVTSNTGELGFLDVTGKDFGLSKVVSVKSVDIKEGTTKIVESFPYNPGDRLLSKESESWYKLRCVDDQKCGKYKRSGFIGEEELFYIKSKSAILTIKLNSTIDPWCRPNGGGTEICSPTTKNLGFTFNITSTRFQNLDAFMKDESKNELLVSNTYDLSVGFKPCDGCIFTVEKVEPREITFKPSVSSRRAKLDKLPVYNG
jgi:outer membrane protein OmpA-like peptidoglycan-associated protein